VSLSAAAVHPLSGAPTLIGRLDELGAWRRDADHQLAALSRFLSEHELLDSAATEMLDGMRQRLAADRLVVAFVAEFSRGKSELINAIFFADAGRRVLPATPGRTTMCPVELAYDAGAPTALSLLPIETRLEPLSMAELRAQPAAWTRVALDVGSPEQLARALTEVMRTHWVPVERARQLGLWDDDRPEDNPPLRTSDGMVEVPAWRHALINYPHPLLKRGLVVLDTPGLNAIGTEPELTLSLLPSAHAVVFVLGADTGVTKSDLGLWRDHLGAQAVSRYVVLNKIDTLADPLAAPETVRAQIERQRQSAAQTLDVPPERVFPLSARVALAARVKGDANGLIKSRLPELETALAEQLLPQRRQVLQVMLEESARALEEQIVRRIGDRRRQIAEQMLELRGLRGKSDGKVRLMLQRVTADAGEFEQCTARLAALRSIHARLLKETLVPLSSEQLRDEVGAMQKAIDATLFNLGAKKAFIALCQRLRAALHEARRRGDEIHQMLGATFKQLNSDFGFALTLARAPDLKRFVDELDLIERSYVQYLGLSHAIRLSEPRFMEQFRRMLLSKLRVVFESVSNDIELWNRQASAQVDSQLRERRRNFRRRREALERIQSAATELEQRIGELESTEERWQLLNTSVCERLLALRATQPPGALGPAADKAEWRAQA
jgi:hypothetical protein